MSQPKASSTKCPRVDCFQIGGAAWQKGRLGNVGCTFATATGRWCTGSEAGLHSVKHINSDRYIVYSGFLRGHVLKVSKGDLVFYPIAIGQPGGAVEGTGRDWSLFRTPTTTQDNVFWINCSLCRFCFDCLYRLHYNNRFGFRPMQLAAFSRRSRFWHRDQFP